MKPVSIVALTMVAAVLLAMSPAKAEKRIALVVGNSAYKHLPRLTNPQRDADLMAQSLERVGFGVTKVIDADQRKLKTVLRDFGRSLRGSDSVGLFYYAGHGVQVKGENYLVPVDANIQDENEVEFESINVNAFLSTMERAQARINIVILDACRDNPFASSTRSAATRGLARVSAPSGSFIAYATAPGAVALDGSGRNSPYAQALARAIETPGLTIEQVFKQTRRDVQKSTGAKQTPWETSSITGEFYFGGQPDTVAARPAPKAPTPSATAVQKPRSIDRSAEIAFWETVKNSSDKALFEAYLKQFPDGVFASLARLKISELEKKAKTALAAPRPQPEPQAQPSPGGTNRQAYFGPRVVLPYSSQRRLGSNDLRHLGCKNLWVARNEIYDRNGYCFRTAKGRSYFDNSDCRTRSQNILTSLERKNVSLIVSWEKRKGCR